MLVKKLKVSLNVPNSFFCEEIMTKQIDIYCKLKNKDKSKRYLFKSGVFYYFLDEDAKYMSAKYNFKITSFGKNIKCGFPVKALEKYLYIFNNESIELVKENSDKDKVIQLIESINLDEISPKEAYMLLVKLKELIGE